MEIPDAVRQRRLQLGLTQVELASKAGISRHTVHRLENERNTAISELSREGIVRSLKWPRDAFDRIESGEIPSDLETVDWDQTNGTRPEPKSPNEVIAELRDQIANLEDVVGEMAAHTGQIPTRDELIEILGGASARPSSEPTEDP